MTKPDIQTTDELLHAEYETIELAEIKLSKPEPGHYVSGRIIDRWNNQDLRLRKNGFEHEITVASDWELLRFKPAIGVEKQMIKNEWGLDA